MFHSKDNHLLKMIFMSILTLISCTLSQSAEKCKGTIPNLKRPVFSFLALWLMSTFRAAQYVP